MSTIRRPPRPLRLESLEIRLMPASILVTTDADSGPGSLRQAILDAKRSDIIAFAIPDPNSHPIVPVTPLPLVNEQFTIDGTTQPGYDGHPLIELLGTGRWSGLTLNYTGSAVRGLKIDGFQTGIDIEARGCHVMDSTIVGNTGDGIYSITGSNVVQNAHIGRNGGDGVSFHYHEAGEFATLTDSVIRDNGGDGVLSSTNFTLVQGDQIIGNHGNGVHLISISGGDTVTANLIASNGWDGVMVDRAADVAILTNSIHDNGNLGIELLNYGNQDQTAPVLESAILNGSETIVSGSLSSTPDTTFTIEVFGGNGSVFLGQALVTTDDAGQANFTASVAQTFAGDAVTATATGPSGTSEFANPVVVTADFPWQHKGDLQ
jgi:hypothetical protein